MKNEEAKNETVIPQKKQEKSGMGAIIAMSCLFLIVLTFTIFMGIRYFEAKNRTIEIGDTQYVPIK